MTETKTHVAVVDEDESSSRALGRMLRASGFEIVVYRSAEAFINDAANLRLDCVALEIQLGGMSRLELRRRMLALGWAVPVILVTAHYEVEIRREAQDIGCSAHPRKSVRAESLVEAITKAVNPAVTELQTLFTNPNKESLIA